MWLLTRRIKAIIHTCEGKKIEGIGISVPGCVNRAEGHLVFAPNLKWRDVDLRKPIAKATGPAKRCSLKLTICLANGVHLD